MNNIESNTPSVKLKKQGIGSPNLSRRRSLKSLKAAKRLILRKNENEKYGYKGDRIMAHRGVMNFEDIESAMNKSEENLTDNIFSVPNLINKTMRPSKNRVMKLRLNDMSPSSDEKLRRFMENNRVNKTFLNRQISIHPERVLDAPDVSVEYPNIMDWGQNNTIAVALKDAVYLWEASLGQVDELMRLPEETNELISCIKWLRNSCYRSDNILSIGTTFGTLIIYDVKNKRLIKQLVSENRSPITAIVMRRNILSIGLQSAIVEHHDVNLRTSLVTINRYHKSVIHHLKWSPNLQNLAVVSNLSRLSVWDVNKFQSPSSLPSLTIQDKISDVVWNPRVINVLLFCVIDRNGTFLTSTLKLFDVIRKTCLRMVTVSSRVRCLFWSELCVEIAVAIEDDADNCRIRLVNENSLQPLTELIGHRGTIATIVSNPQGDVIATVGHDEQIRLWSCFKCPESRKTRQTPSSSSSKPSILSDLERFR